MPARLGAQRPVPEWCHLVEGRTWVQDICCYQNWMGGPRGLMETPVQ